MNFILIQGPFNKDTLAHYTAVSSSIVVVSCWITCDTQGFEGMIVKSEPPSTSGAFNINYQKKSVIQGIDFITKNWSNSCKILKIRSDFIIANPDLMFSEITNNNTIYTTSCFSSRYKNYFTDYIIGGYCNSVLDFFKCETDNINGDFPERILYAQWNGSISLLRTGVNSNFQYWLKHGTYVGYRELNLYEPSGFRRKSFLRIIRFILNKIYRRITC